MKTRQIIISSFCYYSQYKDAYKSNVKDVMISFVST